MSTKTYKKAKTSSKNIVKKHNTKKVVKEDEYDDKWIYILLLSTIVILIESLKTYTFNIDSLNLTYSLFLLPIIYFLTNYITKKKGHKSSVLAISLSGIAMVLFVFIMNLITKVGFDFYNVAGDFCAYMASQLVNLTIYQILLNNEKPTFTLIFLNYIFALVINYLFYSLFYMSTINPNTYWIGYFITLLLQSLICIVLSYLDKDIKNNHKAI